ncbi:MAG TPA: DUF2911 domain-containing protein [Gemmatimonadaceae bacterium]|nr:DUF2911 domain-containing protein [Gemmatimonadaceae bacterium]
MTRARSIAHSLIIATLVVASSTASAQALKPAASGRATTSLTLNGNRPPSISIDYGRPHARGRTVNGALAGDLGTVWRLGANEATTLRTDVDLTIGTLTVPKGAYTLAAETSATGDWQLLVNTKTGQWGIPYPKDTELGRTKLTSRTLATPIESFTMWIIPAADGSASGEIRFAWGTKEFSAPWRVK